MLALVYTRTLTVLYTQSKISRLMRFMNQLRVEKNWSSQHCKTED